MAVDGIPVERWLAVNTVMRLVRMAPQHAGDAKKSLAKIASEEAEVAKMDLTTLDKLADEFIKARPLSPRSTWAMRLCVACATTRASRPPLAKVQGALAGCDCPRLTGAAMRGLANGSNDRRRSI